MNKIPRIRIKSRILDFMKLHLPKLYQNKLLPLAPLLALFLFLSPPLSSKALAGWECSSPIGEGNIAGRCVVIPCCDEEERENLGPRDCNLNHPDPAEICCLESEITCVKTALGNIPTKPGEFVTWIIARAIGLAGGIALLLLVFGGIRYITSRGDAENTKQAAEIMTAAVSGLLLIVFSVVILRILGENILGVELFT